MTKRKSARIELPNIVAAPRTDPIYNCHAYLTKVPVGAIIPFIEEFTEAGDTVMDPFAGSGMTGIAAVMRGRHGALSDISVLGKHIATSYLTEVAPDQLLEVAAEVVASARGAIGDLYETERASDGQAVEMVRTVWSFSYECTSCSDTLVYFNELTKGQHRKPENCPSCGAEFNRRVAPRAEDVPVEVVVRGEDGRLTEQPVAEMDLEAIARALKDPRQDQVPNREISPSREMYRRSALGKHGLTETRLFFSPRNALALLELWNAIDALTNAALRKKLRFAFTAILPRASRRYQWGPKRPLNAQNQTYYIAPVYYEWNVFELFLRKVRAAVRADEMVFRSEPLFRARSASKASYRLASADSLRHVPDNSVDYVFTDPPFGSNIFYADMNLFHEAWLGTTTKYSREAVIHTSGKNKKGAAGRYERLLVGAFAEVNRVLKSGGYMSVVFGNSKGDVWALVQRALKEAGFGDVPAHVAILDKGQRSVKGLSSGSEGVVTVDLVLTVRKAARKSSRSGDPTRHAQARAEDLLPAALDSLDDERRRNPSYVYVATIREAIKRRLAVERLHLSDVLVALRNAGYGLDPKSGLLDRPADTASVTVTQ